MRASLAALATLRNPAVTIVRSGGLGDTILLLPTVDLLRRMLPGVRITLVGSQWSAALEPLLPFPVTMRPFDAAELAPLFSGSAADRLGIFAGNAVIVYTDDPRSAFVQNAERLCKGPAVVHPATQISGTHASLHYARAVADLGMDELPTGQLAVSEEMVGAARRNLQNALGTDEGVIAVHVGSGGRRKWWPAERWVALLEALARPVILVEGPADAAISAAVMAKLPASVRVLRLTERTVAEVAAYIHAAAFYIGNDSGVSHLAAALGVRSVVIFGPTDPTIWGPLNATIIAAKDWPSVDQVLSGADSLHK